MFKTNHVLLSSCLNLLRSCHLCGWVHTKMNYSPGFQQLLRRSLLGPRTILLVSRSTASSSFNFLGRRLQNGSHDPRCWKRSKSDSSYITPGGITFHFDTHKLVRRLQENGFSEEQAESLTSSLVEIITSSVLSVANSTVSKIDQERLEVKFNAMVDSVRNEMFLLEQGKFTRIQEENQKLRDEVASLKGILQDEVAKLKGGMALDFSLEKSRIKEELAVRDQRIKDTENRIETEVAKLGTQLEAQKLDLIKYLVGSLLSCLTLFLAVWRFVKT